MSTIIIGQKRPPRRVRTAYAYFVMDNYKRVAREMRIQQPQPVIRVIANQSCTLGAEKREIYILRQRRDRQRYRMELAEWKRTFGGDEPPKLRRKRKDPYGPKRTRNSFIFFYIDMCPQIRLENPKTNQQDLIQEVARRWRQLAEEDKEEYRDLTTNDKRRYARELREYKERRMREVTLAIRKRISLMRMKERRRVQLAELQQEAEGQNAEQPPAQPAQSQEPPAQQPNQPVQPQQPVQPNAEAQQEAPPPAQPPQPQQ